MADNILQQFTGPVLKDYLIGTISEIKPSGLLVVDTVSGLQLILRDDEGIYQTGDQVTLAIPDNNLSNVFVIRKTNKLYPAAVNLIIASNED